VLPPRGISSAYRIRTKFDRAGNLPNVITHAKCKSIKINFWVWRRVEVSCFCITTADAINTAKPCRPGCLWSVSADMASQCKCVLHLCPRSCVRPINNFQLQSCMYIGLHPEDECGLNFIFHMWCLFICFNFTLILVNPQLKHAYFKTPVFPNRLHVRLGYVTYRWYRWKDYRTVQVVAKWFSCKRVPPFSWSK